MEPTCRRLFVLTLTVIQDVPKLWDKPKHVNSSCKDASQSPLPFCNLEEWTAALGKSRSSLANSATLVDWWFSTVHFALNFVELTASFNQSGPCKFALSISCFPHRQSFLPKLIVSHNPAKYWLPENIRYHRRPRRDSRHNNANFTWSSAKLGTKLWTEEK